MSSLPSSWREVRIEEVCEVNPRDSPPANVASTVSFIPMPAVSDIDGEIPPHETRSFSSVSKGYTRFRNGDVIFANITPCMENGKIAIAKDLHAGIACGSTEFHVVRPGKEVLAEYIWRFLRQDSYRSLAAQHMTGVVGQRRVPVEFLKESVIPLPPLEEQRRVLAKLDGVLDASKSALNELNPVLKLAERYKKAVLASAFRGEITAAWRAENKPPVDANWPTEALRDLVLDIRYGTAAKCHYEPQGTPVLRIPNVAGGKVDVRDLKYGSFEPNEIEKLSLKCGDLLVIRSNGSLSLVGKVAIVDASVAGYLFAGYLIRLRLDENRVLPEFAAFAFEEPSIRNAVERFAKSTSGVNNINSEQLRSLRIPVPSLTEQHEIVGRVRAMFSRIDSLLVEMTRARFLIERLDQAALGKAFQGELFNEQLMAREAAE